LETTDEESPIHGPGSSSHGGFPDSGGSSLTGVPMSEGLRGTLSQFLKRKRKEAQAQIDALREKANENAAVVVVEDDGVGEDDGTRNGTSSTSILALVKSTAPITSSSSSLPRKKIRKAPKPLGSETGAPRRKAGVGSSVASSSSKTPSKGPPVTYQRQGPGTMVVIPQSIRQSAADAYFKMLKENFPGGRSWTRPEGDEVCVDLAQLTLEKEKEMYLASESVLDYRSKAAGLLRRLRKGELEAILPRDLIPREPEQNTVVAP